MKKIWNKWTRGILIIIVGVAIASAAFFMNKSSIDNQVQEKKIIVAKEDISPFGEITKSNVEYKNVVLSEVPPDAITDSKQIKFGDAFASKYGLVKGTPLQPQYITTAAQSQLGSAVGLKNGMYEIGVKTDLAASAGNEIKVGNLVNATAFITAGENGKGVPVSNPNLKNMRVLKVLNSEGKTPDPESGGSLVPAVIVLEVTYQQALQLMEYQETGKVYLLASGLKP